MGFTNDASGKPVFSATPTQTVADLQAAADFAKKYAFMIGMTATQRGLLGSSERWNGLHVFETDTDKEYVYSGGWVLWSQGWTTYTPTTSGFTGTTTAQYKVYRGLVTVRFRVAVTGMTSNPTFSLPINASSALTEHLAGGIALIPGSGSEAIGLARKGGSASSVVIYYTLISGGAAYAGNINSTTPFAWGSTGTIAGQFEYEAA